MYAVAAHLLLKIGVCRATIPLKGGDCMTKDTEKAFVIIYSEYLRRRSSGTAKNQAVRFESAKIKAIDAFSNWNAEDIRYCLWELRKSGYLGIDIFGNVTLLESGIEYMESKPKEFFSAFTETVSGLISLISAFRPI